MDPIKPSALSSNFILSVSLEAKIELEMHLVFSVILVGFKTDCACFSIISSQIGIRTLNVGYGYGASHLFLPVNIPSSYYRCINVVFDYQLFFQKLITFRTKVELSFRFLHFAEHDSPLDVSIFSFFFNVFRFILPSSMSPGSSALVVNFHAL